VNLPVVDTIHPKSTKVITGVHNKLSVICYTYLSGTQAVIFIISWLTNYFLILAQNNGFDIIATNLYITNKYLVRFGSFTKFWYKFKLIKILIFNNF